MVPAFLNQDAMMIFAIIDGFLRDSGGKRISSVIESFPKSMDCIPWRRVYKPLEAHSVTYLIMEHWEASELSFGGAGVLWCFTELLRSGKNISRKTEDCKTWESKSGRGPKKGFPDEILVNRLDLSDSKAFHMLELTLQDQNKPMVALCKIWRSRNNVAAASPHVTDPNIFSPGASTSHDQQKEDLIIYEGTEMEIDQPQGCIQSTRPDDSYVYQESVSFLHKMMEQFKKLAISRRDDAHKIASAAQAVATNLRDVVADSLRINAVAGSTRPNASMEADSGSANPAAQVLEPEATTHDGFLNQVIAWQLENQTDDDINDYCYVDDLFFNFDGENGAV